MKDDFLNDEIWILTFGGGFQRANIYSKNYPNKIRSGFRQALRKCIEELVNQNYQEEVSREAHVQNIKEIVKFTATLKIEKENIPINFGVAQKLLNLYLKYQWCLSKLTTHPPHFPVDRVIQEVLNKEAKKYDLPRREIEPWTQFKDEAKYLEVIDFATIIRDKSGKEMSLAQLELQLFDRRNKV